MKTYVAFCAIVTMCLFLLQNVHAQEVVGKDSKVIEVVNGSLKLYQPSFNIRGKLGYFTDKEWFLVEVKFLLKDPEPAKGVNRIFSKVSVEFAFDAAKLDDKGYILKDPNAGFTLFKGGYSYVNVPLTPSDNAGKSKEIVARMYVHPYLVKRYGGDSKFKKPVNIYAKITADDETLEVALDKGTVPQLLANGVPAPQPCLIPPNEGPDWHEESKDLPMIGK